VNWFENFEEKKWEEATFFSLKTGANCNRLGAGVFPGEREGYTFTWTFKEKAWHMHWSFDDLVVSRLAVTPIKQKVTTMPLEWGKTGKRGFWGWISAAEAAVMAKFQNLGERLEPGHVFSVVRFCGREISEPRPDVVGRPVLLGYSLCPIRRHEISKLCRAEGLPLSTLSAAVLCPTWHNAS
jgi:hypothetical protein